jgi:hypothetical protein
MKSCSGIGEAQSSPRISKPMQFGPAFSMSVTARTSSEPGVTRGSKNRIASKISCSMAVISTLYEN